MMSLKLSAKQVLSNPILAFTRLHPETNSNVVVILDKLWQRHLSLKKDRKAVKLQTSIISRKIGNAKQNGQPVQALLSSMQEASNHLKSLDEDLHKTERQILAYFNLEKEDRKPPPVVSIPAESIRTYTLSQVDTRTISITLLEHQERDWNAYVDKSQASSLYHRAEWREIIQKTYAHESFYFVARDTNKKIVGILPLIHLSSRLFGNFLVSMPYCMNGGAIADHPSIEAMLIQQANSHASSIKIDHIEDRDNIQRHELPVRMDKVNMILPLPDTSTELWMGYTSKIRAQIKRSQREKPRIRFGGREYLDSFHAVYTLNMRDLGSPPHSKKFFQNILNFFPNNSWIIVLYLNNRPVAGAFLIGYGNTLDIPFASTIREVNPLSINMLLYSEVLNFAVQSGFKYFNFGRSTKDTGTYRFKQQWGAQPEQLYWHYGLVKRNNIPHLSPANPKYSLLIQMWKRLPTNLVTWLGPRIVKNIP